MKYYKINLKEVFPCLNTKQEPVLHCYVNDNTWRYNPEKKVPAMLLTPGGAYANVSFVREGEPMAFHFLSCGFSCFVLEYSVAPEHYPAQLTETAASIKYIRDNADAWMIDKDKVAVCGFSAGGHLAASIGVLYNDPFVLDALKVDADYIRPNALVLGYPVITAEPSITHSGTISNVSGTTDVESGMYKKMSLENHVNENTPATYIWHTANDQAVNVRNSICFANALAANKVHFEMHIFPDGVHGLATSDYATNSSVQPHYSKPWLDEAKKFLFDLWFGKEA